MKTIFKPQALVIVVLVLMASCFGYSTKRTLSFRPKPILMANNWKVEKAIENGVDANDSYQLYDLYLTQFGNAKLRAKTKTEEYYTEGSWKFADDNHKMIFKFENRLANAIFKILRVGKNRMWLKKEDSSLELHFVSKPTHQRNSKSSTGY